MRAEDHRQAAAALWRAERRRQPVAPFGETGQGLELADAHAIQRRGLELRLAAGRRLAGHKVALTSAGAQATLAASAPVAGYLLADRVLADGATVALGSLIAPRVEAEVAFRIGRPLEGPELGMKEVMAATDAVASALEICDCRIDGWRLSAAELAADNAAGAGAVIGEWVAPRRLGDLAAVELRLEAGGGSEAGIGAAVLGHPAAAVAWLAAELARRGERLEAGDVVLPGSLVAPVAISGPGEVRVWGPELGAVGVSIA